MKGPFNISARKIRFLLRNLGKGLLWFAGLLVIYFLFERYVPIDEEFLDGLYNQPLLVYLIFMASEIVVGIIPPEIFMLWALKSTATKYYITDVVLLSIISFLAGVLGYFVGRWFHTSRFYSYIRENYLYQYERFLRKFGGFLIIVAAVTPLPFSGICILVGSVQYDFRKFLLYASTRFLRFALYGYTIWQVNAL